MDAAPRRGRLAAGVALPWVLVLAACGTETAPSLQDTTSPTPDEATVSTIPDAAPPADPTPVTSSEATSLEPEPAPADTSSEAPPADPATPAATECLVGVWLADNELFLGAIQEFGDEVKDVAGDVFLTYAADGTMTTDYQGWTITFLSEGMSVTIVREGIDEGEYSATATEVSFSDLRMGSTLTLTGPGMSMEVPPEPAVHKDVPYTCDAVGATLVTELGTVQMERRG